MLPFETPEANQWAGMKGPNECVIQLLAAWALASGIIMQSDSSGCCCRSLNTFALARGLS